MNLITPEERNETQYKLLVMDLSDKQEFVHMSANLTTRSQVAGTF
jgi:hypothetical protein